MIHPLRTILGLAAAVVATIPCASALHARASYDVTLELKLLDAFVQRRGRVLSRDQLLDAAWGESTHVTDRAVDAHIVNLRRKIEPHPAEPVFVVSVRGLGYRFDG